MQRQLNNKWCLFIAAGTLVGASGALAVGPNDNAGGQNAAATFDPNGAFDHEGMAKVDVEAARPTGTEIDDAELVAAKTAAMDAQLAEVFANAPAMSDAATPNYRYLRGVPVPMHLDPLRLLVKAPTPEAAKAAVMGAGLTVAADGHRTVNGYTLVALALPLADLKAADNAIDRVIANGALFASPVFKNPFIEGGFYTPTERALVCVNEGVNAAMAAANSARTFAVTNPQLGNIPGAMELTTTEKNGFRVMAAINELATNNQYRWAQPSALQSLEKAAYVPADSLWFAQWGHRNIGNTYNGLPGITDEDMDTDLAWDLQRCTNSTVISLVMDDGIQLDHPGLNVIDGRDFTTGAVNGVGDGDHDTECENHGTAVAGCIAETMDDTRGGAGTAPGTQLLAAKIYDIDAGECTNSLDAYESVWLVNALVWGENAGARVTNGSFSVGQDDAVEAVYSVTWGAGMVHFASAGNGGADGIGDPTVSFPSSAPNVISVAALRPSGVLAGFSNYGTGLDLSAPGSAVISTDRTGLDGYDVNDSIYFNGTSAASPMAAGVAALFFSQHPFATATQCRNAIFNGCVDIGDPGTDTTFARGFVNAFNALTEYAPVNDTCAGATVITASFYNPAVVNVRWATSSLLEPIENCGSGFNNNSVFYRFTPTNSGVININTNGSTYDTVLSVFEDCVLYLNNVRLDPVQLACDDDGGTELQSQLTNVPVTAGNSVIIKVAKYGAASAGGDLDFNFSFIPTAPTNDECSAATTIQDPGTGPFTYNPALLDTMFATTSTCEATESCGSTTNSNSVYYSFTPQQDGVIDVNTLGTNYDTVLSVFAGCAQLNRGTCMQPQQFGCNDDSLGLQSALAGVVVQAGQTVIIKVADYNATSGGGMLDFNLTFTPAPAPECPSDWDADGDADSDDIIAFFADWENGEGDADGDLDSDSDDVIEFFGHWDAGC